MGLLQLNHRQELKDIVTPSATETHRPVHHLDALEMSQDKFEACGYSIEKETITLAQDGMIMAVKWLLGIEGLEIVPSHQPQAILLHSNNKTLAMRIGFGLNCRVCTNGMFYSEKVLRRKHTKNIYRDLPGMIYDMVASAGDWYGNFMGFLGELKEFNPQREYVHDFLVRSMEAGVIASSHIKKVLDIFKEPTFEEYGQENLYTLHSSYTEVMRDSVSDIDLPRKTIRLNEMMEQAADSRFVRKLNITF